jgi:hypothetical protein
LPVHQNNLQKPLKLDRWWVTSEEHTILTCEVLCAFSKTSVVCDILGETQQFSDCITVLRYGKVTVIESERKSMRYDKVST